MAKKLKKIVELELNKKVGQTKLAKKLAISQGTIYKILETDTVHDLKTYLKFHFYFKIPLLDLIDDDIIESCKNAVLKKEEGRLVKKAI